MPRPKGSVNKNKEEILKAPEQEVTETAQPDVEVQEQPQGNVDPAKPEQTGNEQEVAAAVATEQNLRKSGLVLPATYRHIKTGKPIAKWHMRDLGHVAEVYEGSRFVRAYHEKEFGKDYAKLAKSIVDKKNRLLST